MHRSAEPASSKLTAGDDNEPEGGRTRVLFVDSSVVLRRALKELFSPDAAMEAFTSAPDRDVVLLNIAKTRPHLAVIDADREWQEVSSLIAAVRTGHRGLRLVLITNDAAAVDQLAEKGKALGASGCWLKTSGFRNPDANVRRYLKEKTAATVAGSGGPGVAASGQGSLNGSWSGSQRTNSPRVADRRGKKSIIVIGVSTGGPDALSVLLPLLPADLNAPVLIVQHTLAAFTALLVERLQKRTSLTVLEAQDGMVVTSGQIVVAPGNRHMQVAARSGQVVLVLNDGPPENSCRPAVDPLFRSAARIYGAHVLGVILTGMGQDGLAGCRDLKRAGATILVQDESSSTVWGMPGQVAQAGLADLVLNLKDMAGEMVQQVGTRPKARLQA